MTEIARYQAPKGSVTIYGSESRRAFVAAGWTRTNDLQDMSLTRYQLRHPAIFKNHRPSQVDGFLNHVYFVNYCLRLSQAHVRKSFTKNLCQSSLTRTNDPNIKSVVLYQLSYGLDLPRIALPISFHRGHTSRLNSYLAFNFSSWSVPNVLTLSV